MADHHMTINFEKTGAAFNTVAEAMEAHFTAIGDGSTIEAYNGYAAGLTGVTSTEFLTSQGAPVAAGTPGNGYSIKQVWTEAALKAEVIENGATDTSSFQTGGWTSTSKDINPDTGLLHVNGWHLLS